MQTNPTPQQQQAPGLLGRLVRWYKTRVIRRHIADLSQQLSTLRQHMAIDAVLAEQNREHFLNTPALPARMRADRLMELQLARDIAHLQNALAELEPQP